jgi:hypothetical protein
MSFANFRAVLPSSFLMGLTLTHFINISTTTKRCVNPEGAVFNGSTMSSPHTAKGQVIGMSEVLLLAGEFALSISGNLDRAPQFGLHLPWL